MSRTSKKEITGRRGRQQARRLRAAQLFSEGKTRAAVARILGVSWRSVHEWHKTWKQSGESGLKAGSKPGPTPKFSDEEVAEVETELKAGAVAQGYSNELWTLRRISALILKTTGKRASQTEAWRLLRRMGWSPQKPIRQARERSEETITQWKEQKWPEICRKAKDEGRTIVFVDECGFSQKSTAKRTWAPSGETPIVQMNFNWDKLSVIGGISLKSIYFQVHEESIKSEQVITFLEHLSRYAKGKLLVVWDGLPAHRSKKVATYLASTEGRIWVERLPAYAPELNPIEYLWGNIKGSDLANYAPKELWELSKAACDALIRKRRRPKLLRAFWIQTQLDLTGL